MKTPVTTGKAIALPIANIVGSLTGAFCSAQDERTKRQNRWHPYADVIPFNLFGTLSPARKCSVTLMAKLISVAISNADFKTVSGRSFRNSI